MDLDPGDPVRVTIGKETFFPIKFNGFDVGPVEASTTVRGDETPEDAYVRAATAAEVMFAAQFEVKMRQYFERLARVDEGVEARRRGG
jgi:hypothetical protein